MALTLSMKSGSAIYIGSERFCVADVLSSTKFVLVRKEEQTIGKLTKTKTHRHVITNEHSTEVLPDVWVSAGEGHPANVASVVFEAPRNIVILREELKMKEAQA